MINRILITGGCGFIGSHLSEYLFHKFQKAKIIIYDKITYAAKKQYINEISSYPRVQFIKGDINDLKKLITYSKNIDLLIHVAAESHVDKSFLLSNKFIVTNVLGTSKVMEACRINKIKKIVHVSTDEVYGEIFKGSFSETSRFNPSNPYSSSKAAAEMIVNGYKHSYKLPITIVRSNNIYGTRQYPEKLISGCCLSLVKKRKFYLHGTGKQKRTFLHVTDFCEAIYKIVINKKTVGQIYNIGSYEEFRNIDIVKFICNYLKVDFKKNIFFTKDRPFNDFRYSVNFSKLEKLKWKPCVSLRDKIPELIDWYKKNNNLFR
jgi:dTDP-glucose 4,6-dehydratase